MVEALLLIFKVIFLFLTFWLGSVYVVKIFYAREDLISWNGIIPSLALTGFITLQWLI